MRPEWSSPSPSLDPKKLKGNHDIHTGLVLWRDNVIVSLCGLIANCFGIFTGIERNWDWSLPLPLSASQVWCHVPFLPGSCCEVSVPLRPVQVAIGRPNIDATVELDPNCNSHKDSALDWDSCWNWLPSWTALCPLRGMHSHTVILISYGQGEISNVKIQPMTRRTTTTTRKSPNNSQSKQYNNTCYCTSHVYLYIIFMQFSLSAGTHTYGHIIRQNRRLWISPRLTGWSCQCLFCCKSPFRAV